MINFYSNNESFSPTEQSLTTSSSSPKALGGFDKESVEGRHQMISEMFAETRQMLEETKKLLNKQQIVIESGQKTPKFVKGDTDSRFPAQESIMETPEMAWMNTYCEQDKEGFSIDACGMPMDYDYPSGFYEDYKNESHPQIFLNSLKNYGDADGLCYPVTGASRGTEPNYEEYNESFHTAIQCILAERKEK